MFLGTSIRGDAPGRDDAVTQGPEKLAVPSFAVLLGLFDVGEGARDAFIGVVDSMVEDIAVFGLESVFLVPDVHRCGLEGDIGAVGGDDAQVCGFHWLIRSHVYYSVSIFAPP